MRGPVTPEALVDAEAVVAGELGLGVALLWNQGLIFMLLQLFAHH